MGVKIHVYPPDFIWWEPRRTCQQNWALSTGLSLKMSTTFLRKQLRAQAFRWKCSSSSWINSSKYRTFFFFWCSFFQHGHSVLQEFSGSGKLTCFLETHQKSNKSDENCLYGWWLTLTNLEKKSACPKASQTLNLSLTSMSGAAAALCFNCASHPMERWHRCCLCCWYLRHTLERFHLSVATIYDILNWMK